MTWSRAIPEHFVLADGRVITTLREAGELILGLPERHRTNGHWQSAMERLMASAEDPSAEALEGLIPIRARKRR